MQGHFEIFSVIFYVIVKLKIRFFQKSNKVEQMNERNTYSKTFAMEAIAKNSITNFRTNLMILSVYLTFIVVTVKLNRSSLADMNNFPDYLYLYFFQLISPICIVLSIGGIIYRNNSTLRSTLMAETRSFMQVTV